MASKDPIGDRIKQAEVATDPPRITGETAYAIRLDGHKFSNFTRGMKKPFDERLCRMMVGTTLDLMTEYNDVITAYTESDEITLIFRKNPSEKACPVYGGRVQKMASLTAAYATARFIRHMQKEDFTDIPNFENRTPYFDSRVIRCKSNEMAADCLWWRHRYDTFRNGVSSLCQSTYAKSSLHGVSTKGLLDRLQEDGILINDYPRQELFYGTLCKRVQFERNGALRSRVESRVCDLREYDEAARTQFICVDKFFT